MVLPALQAGEAASAREGTRRVSALDFVDVAFAANLAADGDEFVLGHLRGAWTGHLDGLVSRVGVGLGGQCIARGMPVSVVDYVTARGITHQFDHAVAAEGLHAMVALPLVLRGKVRGAIYGAVRQPVAFSDRAVESMLASVQRVTRLDDAVGTAPGETSDPPSYPPSYPPSAAPSVGPSVGPAGGPSVGPSRDLVQSARAELLSILPEIGDSSLSRRLAAIAALLDPADALAPGPPSAPEILTPREREVLAAAAMGASTAEIAELLALSKETVKSYLKSAMRKLDSHSRLQAVYQARRLGALR